MVEAILSERIQLDADSEFAVAQGIDHEPAFNLQTKHVLTK